MPKLVIIEVILYDFCGRRKLLSVMMTAKVNLEQTMPAISKGMRSLLFGERMTDSTDLPTMRRPISPKHIISASSVPSLAIKLSLYLY